jgi:protein-L-isoaspartate(D-aspartate) O-methyltransferase
MLKTQGVLTDASVERAFRRIPRHLFVEQYFVADGAGGWTPVAHDPLQPSDEDLARIYSDVAVITRVVGDRGTSSASQPTLVAQMLHLLDLHPGMRVLEIGAGTGYHAALIASVVGDPGSVTTLDVQADVVEQARRGLARAGLSGVTVLCRDGADGAPEAAPVDRIVATVGLPHVSPAWAEQLAPGGFLLLPLRHASANPLVRLTRADGSDDLIGRVVGHSGFMGVHGSLDDQRYYPPAAVALAEDAPSRPAPPALRDGSSRLGFWFFLGLADPRVRLFRWFEFGLDDGGRSARVEEERLVGDPALVSDIEAHYRAWSDLGAPTLADVHVRLTRRSEAAPQAGGLQYERVPGAFPPSWTRSGRDYDRTISLI